MNELILCRPTKEMETKLLEYKEEYFRSGSTNVNGSSGLAYYDCFDEWLQFISSIEGCKRPNDVKISTFFSVRKKDNKIIGSLKIRHLMRDQAEEYGGHISYGVRPSERGKGYGKKQLHLALELARDMEITEVLIVCDKSNIASAKTAISCGGELHKEYIVDGTERQHYRIENY